MNKVILMGRLTKDPELRQSQNGISVARFTIAVNRRFAKDGQQQADFINCVAWRQTGEFIAKYFEKGSMFAVTGSMPRLRLLPLHIAFCRHYRPKFSFEYFRLLQSYYLFQSILR